MTTSTTHGMPRTAISRPRFVLQIITSTTPATATPAIFNKVTLAGGATNPSARRWDS